MKRYALLFRMDLRPESRPTPAQMERYMASWGEWIGWLQAEDRLEDGNHFQPAGAVLRGGGVVEKAIHVADRASVAGYLLVRARNLDDAIGLARKCPILDGDGTSVEVREVAAPG